MSCTCHEDSLILHKRKSHPSCLSVTTLSYRVNDIWMKNHQLGSLFFIIAIMTCPIPRKVLKLLGIRYILCSSVIFQEERDTKVIIMCLQWSLVQTLRLYVIVETLLLIMPIDSVVLIKGPKDAANEAIESITGGNKQEQSTGSSSKIGTQCKTSDCGLPTCFCPGQVGPIPTKETPQIVMFEFDDAVNGEVVEFYRYLFNGQRKNPNGCPISATLFVMDKWTNYTLVKELYLSGHEIGVHSISHRMPESWWHKASYNDWRSEMDGQRTKLIKKSSIPKDEIGGVRAPFLETGGDNEIRMIKDFSFEYEATFMTGPHKGGGAWPFTLDYAPEAVYCTNRLCPNRGYPGVWEVPINRWTGLDGDICVMVDECHAGNKDKAYQYFKRNFLHHYNGNRAPFGINMHATWFQDDHKLQAVDKFITEILKLDDVYVLTVHQTLQWMRNPRNIKEAVDFVPWKKSCGGKANQKLVKVMENHRVKSSRSYEREGTRSTTVKPKPQTEHKITEAKYMLSELFTRTKSVSLNNKTQHPIMSKYKPSTKTLFRITKNTKVTVGAPLPKPLDLRGTSIIIDKIGTNKQKQPRMDIEHGNQETGISQQLKNEPNLQQQISNGCQWEISRNLFIINLICTAANFYRNVC